MRAFSRLLVVCCVLSTARADDADGWITHPEAQSTPVVLEFARELTLNQPPAAWPVRITADNRFILIVNGRSVARGPSTGTLANWRVATVDIAPWLRHGVNRIEAVVWNFGDHAPLAQQSRATGLRVEGGGISTSEPGWRVRIDASRTATSGKEQIDWNYYVASAPETIDARIPPAQWRDAVAAPTAARHLIIDPLPAQRLRPVATGKVVRVSGSGGMTFPLKPVVIPAHTDAKLLLRREAMVSAYPALTTAGGRDARIELQYGEALYDKQGEKADRDLVGERELRGFRDTFFSDGRRHRFEPLWWRTFRYLEIAVTTQDEPLTLRGLELQETGYPFDEVARFKSSDAELDRIWAIGWRTLRVDAHETFMDSSYWEQLQYTGDTRLEMLITYAVAGDPRLARQAIDAFAESDEDNGLMQGAYPSRGNNVIATFAFAWIGMLSDWSLEQPDTTLLVRHLPRVRRVLGYFAPLRNARGLIGKNPHWNFIDWSGQRWDDRDNFPSWGSDNGSCLMTAMWVGALRQAEALERAHGEPALADDDAAKADAARLAIREHCWDGERGLFADDAERKVFSQHMNVFAVLYDIATPEEAPAILERITVPGRGIDAPPGMYAPTYYFAWYLVRAFEHAGLGDRYFDLLKSWRDLLPLHFTTWPESRGKTRSDTHAWSAHPTADLLGIVAGIRPAAPGYSRLRIEPHLGTLTSLDATAATPHGPVRVQFRLDDQMLTAIIDRPANLLGDLVWRGKRYPLTRPRTHFRLAAN